MKASEINLGNPTPVFVGGELLVEKAVVAPRQVAATVTVAAASAIGKERAFAAVGAMFAESQVVAPNDIYTIVTDLGAKGPNTITNIFGIPSTISEENVSASNRGECKITVLEVVCTIHIITVLERRDGVRK
ncbi:MAG: hypothetical protein U0136_05460 [Bdellovibrionota bacterium]